VFVELHLDDLVEAAIDRGKTFVHLFTGPTDLVVHLGAEAADLIAHVGADILAFFFDEAGKFLELGLFVFWHAGQYTILMDLEAMGSVGVESGSLEFAKRRRIFQGPDLQKDERVLLFG
jgi:hypothetical protein